MNEIKLCALQLGTLPLSDARLDYYLNIAKEKGAKIVLLGEYVLNSFFNELKNMPKSMIKEQSASKKIALQNFAIKYNLHIIAPLVQQKGKELFKTLVHFTPTSTKYKYANALMPYSHWNEAAFFAKNKQLDIANFSIDGFKFALMFGFEAHFDEFWALCRAKKIDCVLISTACALNSNERWDNLLCIRAFTNNVYILRANRLGKANFKEKSQVIETNFYGRSMLCSPHGEILQNLDEKEGMLFCKISKNELTQAKKLWRFAQISAEFNKQ